MNGLNEHRFHFRIKLHGGDPARHRFLRFGSLLGEPQRSASPIKEESHGAAGDFSSYLFAGACADIKTTSRFDRDLSRLVRAQWQELDVPEVDRAGLVERVAGDLVFKA